MVGTEFEDAYKGAGDLKNASQDDMLEVSKLKLSPPNPIFSVKRREQRSQSVDMLVNSCML